MFKTKSARGHSNFDVLYEILVDYCQLLVAACAVCFIIWLFHSIIFEFNLLGMLGTCASLIETYTWTSLLIVCFLTLVTYDTY